jgi:hypothetical protein
MGVVESRMVFRRPFVSGRLHCITQRYGVPSYLSSSQVSRITMLSQLQGARDHFCDNLRAPSPITGYSFLTGARSGSWMNH